jgi:hypothetical protein
MAVMTELLLWMRSLVDPIYEKFISRMLEVHSCDLMRQPISRPTLAEAAIRHERDDLLIKAAPEALAPHLGEFDSLPTPWLWPRTVAEGGFQFCGSSSCFAADEGWEWIVEALERWRRLVQ